MDILPFASWVEFLSSKWKLVSFLDLLFFGLAFGVATVAGLVLPPPVYTGQKLVAFPQYAVGNVLLMILYIFAFNLVLSAFLLVTLPGIVFFPLSALTLGLRALLRGLMLYQLPLWYFLAAVPTVMLEGEAYVLAATVGMSIGLAWLKPEGGASRAEALRGSLKQSSYPYLLVALILFASAIVESITILFI